ncbi:minichromosome maintenance domain-containing protein 2-like isoform X2 [Bolinopsis microptera]|uniref:minichromosome maintenance domain-containing protein 2-like isoform X2 n=1 Tax=Bolinopsis microptera TaxID=2820187 RepID=UPI003079DD6C
MEEEHHCKLYNWLVQSDSLNKCQNQIEASRVLQRIEIFVDTLAILEFDGYLGNCLVGNYLLFCKLNQEVLFEVFKETIESVNQLWCIIRPTSALRIENPELLSSVDSTAMVNYWGRVIAARDPVPYTQSTQYRCSAEFCNGAHDSSHIRVYTLNSRECDVINSNLRCTECSGPLHEDVANRTIGRRMSISLQLLRVEGDEARHYVDCTIDVLVRDELLTQVTLGSTVSIVGLQYTKLKPGTKRYVLEAVNVEQITSPVPRSIPRSIKDIYSVRERSPWQLLSLLAFCVTPQSLPQGAYHTVKQLLLLSLIRTGPIRDPTSPLYLPTAHPDHHPSLNLLLQSPHTLHSSRLLALMALLTDVQAFKSMNTLGGVRDGNTLHAGLLTTSSGGVAVVSDVDLMKKEDVLLLTSTLQNRAVIIGKKKTEVTKECDETASIENVLEGSTESLLPEVDVKAYLALASTICVQYDKSCTRLIAGYCQASKSVRYGSDCEQPQHASYTLHLLAGNHSRINFRDIVLDVDAVAAIKLYEESLLSSQHYSSVHITTSTHINPGDEDEYLGDNVDGAMEQFYSKLVQFCSTHIAGFSPHNED